MIQLVDQILKKHNFQENPIRIVSLVPSQTELLFDLGLENSIVGITKFCVHPKHFLNEKTKVGGTKNPNFDKIKALNPDIIICNKEENTKEIIEECSKICSTWTTNIVTIEDNFIMIQDFGKIFKQDEKASQLTDSLSFALSDFKEFIETKSIKKVAYFIWKNPFMVVGTNNYINEILRLNKFENVFENNNYESNRYPEIQLEILENENLDLIFLSSEPYPFKEKDFDEIQKFTTSKIIIVDGEMFSWHGSRLLIALDYFKKLHKNL
jgi:iron complex transport system substrate-binding protein